MAGTRKPDLRRKTLLVSALTVGLAGVCAVVLFAAAELGVIGRKPVAPPVRGQSGYSVALYDTEGEEPRWALLDESSPPAVIVLLIHGLDEPGSIWDDLTPALHDAGFAVARFEYPNDQGIADSARMLRDALTTIRSRGVVRINLVCHSMGGLVARDALTREDPSSGAPAHPDVRRLITVGTPNHGSPWAPLRGVAEAREQIDRWMRSLNDPPPLSAFLDDGRGEAGIDLAPESPYLLDLNSRPLPTGVAITIIAGRWTPFGREETEQFVDSSILQWIAGEQDIDAVEDAVNLLGDGVVPLESAMLDGVDDVVVIEGNHRAMLKSAAIQRVVSDAAGTEAPVPPAIPIILDRLRSQ